MKKLFPIILISASMTLSGCASHIIATGKPDGTGIAGMPYTAKQTSIMGRQGISSDGASGKVAGKACDHGLNRVEARRSFGDGLVSVLTFGLVSPVTFHYLCEKPPEPKEPCNCEPQDDDQF